MPDISVKATSHGRFPAADVMLFHGDETDNTDHTKSHGPVERPKRRHHPQERRLCRGVRCVADHADVEPRTDLVITDTGQLAPRNHAYDTRVAGVILGAGGLQPGIRLGRLANGTARTPVALVGKVFCKVDAAGDPIEVGSFLTTWHTPGHGMRVSSPSTAIGTVLGKALAPHHRGLGLIPILVTLQ